MCGSADGSDHLHRPPEDRLTESKPMFAVNFVIIDVDVVVVGGWMGAATGGGNCLTPSPQAHPATIEQQKYLCVQTTAFVPPRSNNNPFLGRMTPIYCVEITLFLAFLSTKNRIYIVLFLFKNQAEMYILENNQKNADKWGILIKMPDKKSEFQF